MMRRILHLASCVLLLASLADGALAACPTAGPLLLQNELSEIACRGTVAQAAARSALGIVAGAAAGTNGQVQLNSGGALAGVTLSGDATLDPTTGTLTVIGTNGVPFPTYFASPPPIGGIVPAAGAFTSLSGNLSGAALPASQGGTVAQVAGIPGTATRFEADAYAASALFSGVRIDGTPGAPAAIQSGDQIGGFNAFGHNGTQVVGPSASLRAYAAENWAPGSQGAYMDLATTPAGTATLTEVLRLEADGGMDAPGATGGDQGVGTINLPGGYFLNGVNVGALAQGSLQATNNLSDLANAATARASLGLGSIATQAASALDVTGVTLLTGLPVPVNSTDAATKAYVDASAEGLTVHQSVAVATVAVLPFSPTYDNGSSGVGATLTATGVGALVVNGYSVNLNDRVLVQDQAAPAQNGCYVLTIAGTGSVDYVLTRCADFNTVEAGNIATNAYFFVAQNATSFLLTTTGSITVGTTDLTFTQFSSSASYAAGTSLALVGNTFSVASGGVAAAQMASGAAKANLGYTPANVASNLADLASASTARTNLGLGTAATVNTGASGATIPVLNAANSPSALWTFGAGLTVSSGNVGITTGNFTVNSGVATISGGSLVLGAGSITAGLSPTSTINVHTQYGIGGSFYSGGTVATQDYLQFWAQPSGAGTLGMYAVSNTDTEIPINLVPKSASGTSLVNVANGVIANAPIVQGNGTNTWNQNEVRVASDKYFADSANGFTLWQASGTFGGNQLTGIASSGTSTPPNGVITFSSLSTVPAAPPAYGTVSITTGGTMTASGTVGTWAVGQNIIPTGARFSVNGMAITAFVSGTGGNGTYTVFPAPTVAVSARQVIGQIPGGLVYVAADTTTPANLPTNSFLLASGAGTATVSGNASAVGTDAIAFYPTVGARSGTNCFMTQGGPTGDFATTYGQPFYSCGSFSMLGTASLGGTSPTNQYGILSTFNTNLGARNVLYASELIQSEWDNNIDASSSGGIIGYLKFIYGSDGFAQAHGYLNEDFGLAFGASVSGTYSDKGFWMGGGTNWSWAADSVWFDADLAPDKAGAPTTASFATNVMTVTAAVGEGIQPGNVVSFLGVAPGTTVVAQLTQNVPNCPSATCPGQAGTYSLSTTPGTIASESGVVYTVTSGQPLMGALNVTAATLQPPAAGGYAVQSNGMWIDSLGAYHAGLSSLAPTSIGAAWDVTDSVATSFTIVNGGQGYQVGAPLHWHDGWFVVGTVNLSTGAVQTLSVWEDPNGNFRYPTYAGRTGQPATISPILVGRINASLGGSGLVLAPNWTTPDTTLAIGATYATRINFGNSATTTNIVGAVQANGAPGVTCSGPTTSSFASSNGIVTHC